MNQTAELIEQAVSMRRAAEFYGFQINRGGYISCPFHSEKTASLKIYDREDGHSGWYCFGCHKGGGVIQFVMQLFDINYRQAVLRINQDFSLGITTRRTTRSEVSKAVKKTREEEETRHKREEEWWDMIRELWYCRDIISTFQPVMESGYIWYHPLYVDAVKRLPAIENWLDERFQEGEEGDRRHWNKSQNLAKMTS